MKKGILVILVLFSINFVFALGVSLPYWDTNPVVVDAGEVKNIEFALTNKPTADIEYAYVVMEEDAGIAEITSGEYYTVYPGTTSTRVKVKIDMPVCAESGEEYNVLFKVYQLTNNSAGVAYKVNFPVVVDEASELCVLDEDDDGILDDGDMCSGTIGEQIVYGCSCEQILELKPGEDNGELKNGCSKGTIDVFTKKIGWAEGLF